MSRRKQSCPRPVKGPNTVPEPGQTSTNPLCDDTFGRNSPDDNGNTNKRYMGDDAVEDEDDFINSDDNLVIALSPRADEDDLPPSRYDGKSDYSRSKDDDGSGSGEAIRGNTIDGRASNRVSSGGGSSIGNNKNNMSGREFHRPDDPRPSMLTSTLSHHHLLSSNISSTQPPPNFLLQPPPPPPQKPHDFLAPPNSGTSSRNLIHPGLFPHRPSPHQPSSSPFPHPSSTNILDEMARRKRSPNSIRWNHRGLAQTAHPEAELIHCQICMNQIRTCGDLKTPIEQVDYFVDDDGTLTIKNDICPRTVALSLLCGGPQSQKTFRMRLGDDYNMFILNLEQILKKHPQTCPGELASQVASADDLIQEHHLRQKLLSHAHSRKRTHDVMSHGDNGRSVSDNVITASHPEAILTIQKQKANEEAQSDLPDNFLSIPPSREETPPPHVGKHPENNNNLPLTLSEPNIPKSLFDDNNNSSDNMLDMTDKSLKEDAEEKEVNSRSVSPASLIAQGMTVAEAAIANKQMANTKRGSKILPVSASTDGLVKYQCPICSLELSGDHELTVHIRSHNQSHLQVMPNTCTICGKTLSSQSSLDRHMLVHSGERPFRCSICDMSFTTNGNMHRHSRIHQKNGINIKPIGRKSAEPKSSKSSNNNNNNNNSSSGSNHHQPLPSSASSSSSTGSSMQPQFPSAFRDDLSTPKRKGGHHVNAPTPSQPDQSVEFLHYMNDMKSLQQLKLLSMSNYMFPFNAAPPTHSAFPMSPYVHEQLRLQYLQAFMNPLNGESLAKRPCFPPFVVPPPRVPSPDLREPTVHRCRECDAEFTNQFALESHMESHVIVDEKMEAEAGTACKTCKTVAKSAESLLLHTLTHHKPQEDVTMPDPQPETTPLSKESSTSPSEMETDAITIPISTHNEVLEIEKKPSSFMNLGFADCTTKKFPLIAKAFCEDNPDLKAKNFPVFKCEHCDKEFPVEGAKDLHEASHVPEEYTKCPKCNCHFSDSSKLQDHMLKHVSDLKFEESLEKGQSSKEAESSESMSQNYFLAQFGLITSEDQAGAVLDDNKCEENIDNESIGNASINNDDPSESVMSEDMDSHIATTDNEDDARSFTSETKILTIPINNNNNNKKEEMRLYDNSKVEKSSLPSSEILTDMAAMQAGRSPASSIGSDFMFPGRMQDGPLLTLPTKQKDEVLPPMFPCKYCDAVLSTAADLKNHQILHKDPNPFQCKVCPYASTDKSTLLRHMRTHSGERPYKCKLCDYSFTTKANCERHLRQKHNLDKDDLKDQLIHRQFDVQQLLEKGNKSGGRSQGRAICKSCDVDFFNLTSLQQHIQMNKECHFIYGCKSCMMTFPTKTGISQHMAQKHSDVPADKIGQYFTKIENSPTLDVTDTTPPPAHSKSPSSSSKKLLTEATAATSTNVLDKVSTTGTKLLKSYLTARNNAKTNTIVTNPALHLLQSPQPQLLSVKPEPESPLNFAKGIDQQKQTSTPINKISLPNSPNVAKSENETPKQEDLPVFDDQPLDLSVSRSSSPSSVDPTKGQGYRSSGSTSSSGSPTKQVTRTSGLNQSNMKQEPGLSPSQFMNTLNNRNRNTSLSPRSLLGDRNNNHLSSMLSLISPGSGNSMTKPRSSSPAPSSSSTILGMSPSKSARLDTGGMGVGISPSAASASVLVPPSHLPKHPAFPQFLPILGLTSDGRPQQVISPMSPNSRPGSSSSPVNASRRKRTATPDKAAHGLGNSNASDIKISMQAMQPSVILTDLKEKKNKGSSSGSESSCELSSVSKMLNATDAQNFQEYLTIPETEDEQDSMSVSEMSGEDSNMSMENMFSNSYLDFQKARLARIAGGAMSPLTDSSRKQDSDVQNGRDRDNKAEGVETGDGEEMTLTVGMALMDGDSGRPDFSSKPLLMDDKDDGKHTDPSNMSEQEIARLIEKVSRENDGCPTKKKRNSYADSPHKFSCPYCPRCFPWMSSLNRHLLTHTGQKPFRCSRCPVTFSTKSNRERHLIRKHNVNMLDPSSRSTMDRPYKCQLCVFSSFSTKSNLIKHYKDRHNGAEPPLKALEALDGLDDLEGEDSNGKTCEEEEEEYALAQKMQENGLADDSCDLLQGYYQDNNNNSDSFTGQRDPHKKRNVLFDLSLGDGSKQDTNNPLSTSNQNGDNSVNNNNNSSLKDNNNLSLLNAARNQSSSNNSARSSPTTRNSSSTNNLPGIDETVLTDTVREFLDKSLQQSLEDSQRKALEEGSTFWITPAMERHLRRLDHNNSNGTSGGTASLVAASSSALGSSNASQSLQCVHCNLEFPSKKKLLKHLKIHKIDNLPYSCHLCDDAAFATRVECLQHLSVAHREEWRNLEEHNAIRNVEVFATRLDKMVIKSHKRGKSVSNGDKQEMSEDCKNSKGKDDTREKLNEDTDVFEDGKKEDGDNKDDAREGSDVTKTNTNSIKTTKKVHCALCADVFGSAKELCEHMASHTGIQIKPLSQDVPSTATPQSSSPPTTTPATGGSNQAVGADDEGEGGNIDMLHNLLGVESSTIDEIFDARVSAASILGVGGKAPKP